jgi:hypothetical protein
MQYYTGVTNNARLRLEAHNSVRLQSSIVLTGNCDGWDWRGRLGFSAAPALA